MEDVKLVKVKKNKRIVDKCMNCRNSELIPMKEFKHEFDNEIFIDDGLFCSECETFHYNNDDNNLIYEHVYENMYDKVKKVNWKISDN